MISRHHLSCGLLCLLKITFLEMIAVSTVKLFVCIELETKVFECGYDTYMWTGKHSRTKYSVMQCFEILNILTLNDLEDICWFSIEILGIMETRSQNLRQLLSTTLKAPRSAADMFWAEWVVKSKSFAWKGYHFFSTVEPSAKIEIVNSKRLKVALVLQTVASEFTCGKRTNLVSTFSAFDNCATALVVWPRFINS